MSGSFSFFNFKKNKPRIMNENKNLITTIALVLSSIFVTAVIVIMIMSSFYKRENNRNVDNIILPHVQDSVHVIEAPKIMWNNAALTQEEFDSIINTSSSSSSFAGIFADKMNVFYIGVDNPVSISAGGIPAANLNVS